jgi:hypothetical protein
MFLHSSAAERLGRVDVQAATTVGVAGVSSSQFAVVGAWQHACQAAGMQAGGVDAHLHSRAQFQVALKLCALGGFGGAQLA